MRISQPEPTASHRPEHYLGKVLSLIPYPARLMVTHSGKARKGRPRYAVGIGRPSARNKTRWFPTPEAALLAYELVQGGAYRGKN